MEGVQSKTIYHRNKSCNPCPHTVDIYNNIWWTLVKPKTYMNESLGWADDNISISLTQTRLAFVSCYANVNCLCKGTFINYWMGTSKHGKGMPPPWGNNVWSYLRGVKNGSCFSLSYLLANVNISKHLLLPGIVPSWRHNFVFLHNNSIVLANQNIWNNKVYIRICIHGSTCKYEFMYQLVGGIKMFGPLLGKSKYLHPSSRWSNILHMSWWTPYCSHDN